MAVEWRYRTFWPRFFAGFVDGLVFAPLGLVNYFVREGMTSRGVAAAWFVFTSATYPAYSIFMHGRFGWTIGKRAMGVRVVDVSGQALSMTQAFRREAINLVFGAWGLATGLSIIARGGNLRDPAQFDVTAGSLSLVVFALELFTTLMNSKRRALHDFLAGSVVVRTRRADADDDADGSDRDRSDTVAVPIGPDQFACPSCGAPVNFGASTCGSCEQSFDYRDGQAVSRD